MSTVFDRAEADLAAGIPPIVAEKEALIRRVYQGIANDPGVETSAPEELEIAVRRLDRQIEAKRHEVHRRHAEALQRADSDEAHAIVTAGRDFLEALDRRAQFEDRRGRFEVACGAVHSRRFVTRDLRLVVDAFVATVEHATMPRPEKPKAPHVPLHVRVRQLIGV